ncbi:MAG: hypothetical protein ACOC2X_03615, partial [Bacillota bacterium]
VIMIALLSFSLTSITAYTFRTAESTEQSVEENSSSSEGKRLVNEGIARLKREINRRIEDVDDEGYGIEWFQDLTTDAITTSGVYRDFKEDEEDGIKAIEDALTDEDGRGISITEDKDLYDSEFLPDGVHQIAFKVSFPVNDSRDIVRTIYFTDFGVEYGEFDAFEYTMGTNESVALNGGDYTGSTTIYGSRIYRGYSTAYKDSDGNYVLVEANKDINDQKGPDATFVSPREYHCEDQVLCLDTDGDNLELIEDNYTFQTQEDYDNYYSDLFMGFDFDEYYYNKLAEILGMEEESIHAANYEGVLRDETSLETVDGAINQSGDYILDEDVLVDGDASVDLNGNTLGLNGHTMIVLGDLTINSVDAITRTGQLYVFGDVNFTNDRDLLMTSNLYTAGSIIVDFDSDVGFETDPDNPEGMAFFAKDNILFESNTTNSSAVPMFIFSESSIRFESVLSPMRFQGTIYSQGKGDGLSDVFIDRGGDEPEPFKGILVNSLSGTIDPDTGEPNYESGEDVQDYRSDGVYEPGDIIEYQGNFYERTTFKPGNANPSPNARPFWGRLEARPRGDAEDSFRFGDLGSEDDGESVSAQGTIDTLRYEADLEASNVQTMSHEPQTRTDQPSVNIQPMASRSELEETFYDLPDFDRLVIIPDEDSVVSEISTFKYE